MFGIIRVQKYHAGDLRGIEDHMERRGKISNTNHDIKRDKSKNNYDITQLRDRTFNSLIKERLKKEGIKASKQNVVMVELMFSASPEFFENMSADEIRQYFQKCYEFAANKYGKENIISAQVHLDEKSPHMHLEFVPVVEGKLNAKKLFNFKLEKLHDEAYENIFKSYGLERGNKNKDIQHLDTIQFKIKTGLERLEQLDREIKEKQTLLSSLETQIDNTEYKKLERYTREIKDTLFEMCEILQSNAKLLELYKQVREQYKEYLRGTSNEREL